MNKLFLATCVGGVLLLGSCQDRYESVGQAATGKQIGFLPFTGKLNGTRAAATTTANIADFAVYGFATDAATFASPAYIANLAPGDVDKIGGTWAYTPLADWPSGKVTFVAYSPQAALSHLTNAFQVPGTITGTAADTTVMKTLTYTLSEDVTTQLDFLVAYKQQTWAPGASTVTLGFKHAMSRVQFKARYVSGTPTSIDVTGVKLLNLKKTGTLDATTAASTIAWTGITDEVNSLDACPGSATFSINVHQGAAYTNILTGDSAVMVLPQATALGTSKYGVSSTDITDAESDSKFYVLVSWSMGGGLTCSSLCAVPDPANAANGITFVAGKQYTFTFTLDADTNLIRIGNVTVEDMSDVDQGVVTPNPA